MKNKRMSTGWRLLLVSAMLACPAVHAQTNLVRNGDFEAISSYPKYTTQPFTTNPFPTYWSMPTDGTPDVINDNANTCDYFFTPTPASCFPKVCELDNAFGCQAMMPAIPEFNSVGHVYMGLTTAGTSTYFASEFREYVKCTLNISGGLVAGQCYRLKYWVSLADMSSRATTVQAVITGQNLDNTSGFAGALNASNCPLWFRPGQIITNKTGWVQLTYDFIAEGGEKYLYIGFFEYENSPMIDQDVYDVPKTCSYTSCTSNAEYTNANNKTAYYYLDNVSLIATAGPSFTPDYTFNVSNPNITGTFANANILISGNVALSGNATFDNCTVKCNDGTTITVPSGKTFSIINTTTIEAGCANMWEGILVNNGSLVMRGSMIKDAHTAITFSGSSSAWQLYRDASNNLNTFSRNTVDIVFNGSFGAGNVLKATVFEHYTALKDPTQGIGGYGTNNLVFNGAGSTTAEVVGGSAATDGCLFSGGQNGIVSSKYNLRVESCIFTGQANVAIDFSDVPPQSPLRTLTVIGSSFYAAREHIVAHAHVDLTVQACTLSHAQQNSIEWYDNHDNYLQIGDTASASLGNIFNGNGWYAVVAMHNRTWQTDKELLRQNIEYLNGPTAHYTNITIAKNTVNCTAGSSGFLVAEWQLGQYTSYGRMNIMSNTLNGVYNGIQLFNVHGWGGMWPVNPAGLPQQDVKYNMAYTSAQYAADASGIKVLNAPGFAIRENGVSSDNPFNYANQGLYFLNAEYSEVYGNIVSAGTGININTDMLGSNLHCNWLSAYSTGFYMGSAWLRGGITQTHGVPAIEEYNNLVPYTMYPWNADIHVDNSDVANNKWIWGGAAANLGVLYTGNTGSGSLFSPLAAPDRCENGIFPGYPQLDTNIYITFTDTVLQWISDYNYEIRKRNSGGGGGVSIAPGITALIDIEGQMAAGEYADALTGLGSYTPGCNIETNYKDVLTILATLGDESRDAMTGEKDGLIAVAEQRTLTGGPAVTIARGYLEAKYYLHFSDPRPLEAGEIKGTASVSSPCGLAPASNTWLSFIDEEGKDLGMASCSISADGSFLFDPLEVDGPLTTDPYTEYRICSRYGSQFNVVTMDYHTLADWLAMAPLVIDLAGVRTEIDTVTEEEGESITNYTSISADGGAVMYSVGTVKIAGYNQLRITKSDKDGAIWQHSYSGPVEGHENAATAMYLDGNQNVYVAGNVHNGDNYDIQILKYDSDGNQIWMCMFPDANEDDDIPTGIRVNPGDESVEVVATCGDGYRYIKVWECLPVSERRAQQGAEQPAVNTAQPAFYPSPSNGTITVDLKGNRGGVLELYTIAGQVVYTGFIAQNKQLELPATVQSGVYLLKFTGEGEPYHQKLVIQRND